MLRHSLQPALSTQAFFRSSLPVRSFSAAKEQDLVVIGGGPGGYVAAIKAGQLGLSVTCIERRGALGGTCLNVGCIPSKALLNSSHHYHIATHQFKQMGIKVDGISLDLPTMMKQKEQAVSGLTKGIEYLFKKNNVTYVKGHGKITGPNEVQAVKPEDGSELERIKAKNILIATGSEVMPLPGIQIDEEKIVSSTGALSLKSVPKRLLLIGGGVIGLEMGSVWSRLGSQVDVVEFLPHICAGADAEIAKEFKKILEKQGLNFHMKTKVTSAKVQPNGTVKCVLEPADGGKPTEMEADVVLVAIGRRPFTANLGLESVGIQADKRGRIEVNQQFQTKVPSIRAIGDVIAGPMLAHKAEEEGIAAVEHIVSGHGHVNYSAIPSVIYTHPEVAWVGATEEELKQKGIEYKAGRFPFKANSRARTVDDAEGFVKFLSDAKTDQILGCHIIGPGAGELIQETVLGIEYGASTEDIARTCHAHPTMSEAVKEAALATFSKPIHS